jgi:D-alanyl-D-alanine dipeptidase
MNLFSRTTFFGISPATLLCSAVALQATPSPTPPPELVDIKKIDPTIVVELRYAGSRNIAGRALYSPHMPALVRPSVAQRLIKAQAYLQVRGYCLKIWDAYRPPLAQLQLWQLRPDSGYIANPNEGRGSLHTWGVAIDATLVAEKGGAVEMPTDFDTFTPVAGLHYPNWSAAARKHLRILQGAMGRGGFYGLRMEWWHFIAYDWKKYRPVGEIRLSAQ